MEFIELVKKRYSVRSYSDKAVDRGDILKCVEAARLAPSACNSQPWKFVIIDRPALRDKAADAICDKRLGMNSFARDCPVLIAIVSQRQKMTAKIGGLVKKKNFSQMDVGIAAEHFCLQAAELGLGTCMVGWFDEKAIKKLLNVSGGKRVELVITLGWPMDDGVPVKRRKDIGEIVEEK